jgi:hypothetical protein
VLEGTTQELGISPSAAIFAGGDYPTWIIPGSTEVALMHSAIGRLGGAGGISATTRNASGAITNVHLPVLSIPPSSEPRGLNQDAERASVTLAWRSLLSMSDEGAGGYSAARPNGKSTGIAAALSTGCSVISRASLAAVSFSGSGE